MGTRPNISFSVVEPKLEGGRSGLAEAVPFEVPPLPVQTTITFSDTSSQVYESLSGDVWKEFFLNFGIGDVLSEESLTNFNNFLKKVDKVVKSLTVILKTLRLVSSDFLNVSRALKFALKQIVKTLQELVATLLSTGFYRCVIRPDDSEKDEGYIIKTWGSFNEFKSKIAAACLDRNDPKSPAHLTKSNTVGGFIIGGLAGNNDPSILDNMIANLSLLADLFGLTGSVPAPPKNVKAEPGLFLKPSKLSEGKKLGVKITWSKPDSTGVLGFRVFRCRKKEGLAFTEDQRNEAILRHPLFRLEENIRPLDEALIYRDDDFEPEFVLSGIARDNFSFTDFNVKEDEVYFYSVMSVIKADGLVDKDPWNRRVGSPLMSNVYGVKARYCIPVTEIEDPLISINGDFVSPRQGIYRWESLTLRTYFGPLFDRLIDRVDELTDTLAGMVQTSNDAAQKYIDFVGKRIQTYIQIIQVITNVVTVLVNFRLRGSLLLLNLGPEPGGIENFVDRVMKSQISSSDLTKSETYKSGGDFISVSKSVVNKERNSNYKDKTLDLSAANIKATLYFGLVTVYGYPNDPTVLENYDFYVAPYREEYNDVSLRLKNSQKAIKMLLKILLGKD